MTMMGHNNPPTDEQLLAEQLQGLEQRLIAEAKELIKRQEELLGAVARAPVAIDDDVVAGKMGDFIKQLRDCKTKLDSMREEKKKPFAVLSNSVQAFFKGYIEPLDTGMKTIKGRLDTYLIAKEQRERVAREAAARAEREAAEAKAREAAAAEDARMTGDATASMEQAVQHEAAAVQLEKEAQGKAADLTRTRGIYGSTTSLRKVWVGEIENRTEINLEALRPYLSEDSLQKAINMAVKAGIREIKGVKIYEKATSVSR